MNISLSFLRGMIAAVNPCGFVLLPSYLMYFLGLSSSETGRQRASVGRALVVSAAVSGGFLAVFVVIGVVTQAFTGWVTENAIYATAVIGVVLVVLGAAMLFGYRPAFAVPKVGGGGRDRTVRSMFLYGLAYAVCSIGCTIGLFVSTLFGTANRAGYVAGVANIAVYGLGMALVVTALTVTLAVTNVGLLRVLRRGTQYVEMLAGAFVLLSGVYLLLYFWFVGIQETGDPVTDAVARYQNDVQIFLNENWQIVATVLFGIVGAAVAYSTLARRAEPRETDSKDSIDAACGCSSECDPVRHESVSTTSTRSKVGTE